MTMSIYVTHNNIIHINLQYISLFNYFDIYCAPSQNQTFLDTNTNTYKMHNLHPHIVNLLEYVPSTWLSINLPSFLIFILINIDVKPIETQLHHSTLHMISRSTVLFILINFSCLIQPSFNIRYQYSFSFILMNI